MRCRKVRTELLGFIHKSLDEALRRAVGEHLWTCAACAEEERRLRSVGGLLVPGRQEVPPPSLLNSTRSKIAGARAEVLARSEGLLQRIWHLSPAALVASVALVVVTGLLMAHSATSGHKARELRQLQQRIQGEGLLRQVHLLQREMPQLADQMVLVGVELVLREVANLDARSAGQEGIQQVQKRLATSRAVKSLKSLVGRAEAKERKPLARLLRAIQEIEKL